jgi:hypothetical protein
LAFAGIMLLNAQAPPDPADLLEQARDKVIARLPPVGYACLATINRSYYRRSMMPVTQQSCDAISAERKRKTRSKLSLYETDRLRLRVFRTSEGESFAWPGPGGFSRNIEEVVQSGHFGTGELGAHLGAIFENPQVRFRLLSEDGKNSEFGFRVPLEVSRYLIKTGNEWHETAYDRTLMIDPASLELKRLTIDTEQLEAQSSLCESSTTLEYPEGGEGVLLPTAVEIHDFNRDGTETVWMAAFSDCQEAPEEPVEKAHEPPSPALFPPTWAMPFKLVLVTPIDTATAAAGDVVQAKLAKDEMGPSPKIQAPAGAILTGRIMRMEHNLHRLDDTGSSADGVTAAGRYSFLIWVDFDTIEAHGAVHSIHARLTCGAPIDPQHLCPFATMSDQKWNRALIFGSDRPDANIVVPAGYKSTWQTGEPPGK